MAKKKTSKKRIPKKDKIKEVIQDSENTGANKTNISIPKKEEEKEPLPLLTDESFCLCVSNVTDIPQNIFPRIGDILNKFNSSDWYSPYEKTLKEHAFDMFFYQYLEEPIPANLENLRWNGLPYGKCIVVGRDSNGLFKAVVGFMNNNKQLVMVYNPEPQTDIVLIDQIGFFISAFVPLSAETEYAS